MLILARKKDESLVIGNNVIITVLGTNGKTTMIGIQAPKGIPVHRTEIYLKICKNQGRDKLNVSNDQFFTDK